jgi:hypothetical protein
LQNVLLTDTFRSLVLSSSFTKLQNKDLEHINLNFLMAPEQFPANKEWIVFSIFIDTMVSSNSSLQICKINA